MTTSSSTSPRRRYGEQLQQPSQQQRDGKLTTKMKTAHRRSGSSKHKKSKRLQRVEEAVASGNAVSDKRGMITGEYIEDQEPDQESHDMSPRADRRDSRKAPPASRPDAASSAAVSGATAAAATSNTPTTGPRVRHIPSKITRYKGICKVYFTNPPPPVRRRLDGRTVAAAATTSAATTSGASAGGSVAARAETAGAAAHDTVATTPQSVVMPPLQRPQQPPCPAGTNTMRTSATATRPTAPPPAAAMMPPPPSSSSKKKPVEKTNQKFVALEILSDDAFDAAYDDDTSSSSSSEEEDEAEVIDENHDVLDDTDEAPNVFDDAGSEPSNASQEDDEAISTRRDKPALASAAMAGGDAEEEEEQGKYNYVPIFARYPDLLKTGRLVDAYNEWHGTTIEEVGATKKKTDLALPPPPAGGLKSLFADNTVYRDKYLPRHQYRRVKRIMDYIDDTLADIDPAGDNKAYGSLESGHPNTIARVDPVTGQDIDYWLRPKHAENILKPHYPAIHASTIRRVLAGKGTASAGFGWRLLGDDGATSALGDHSQEETRPPSSQQLQVRERRRHLTLMGIIDQYEAMRSGVYGIGYVAEHLEDIDVAAIGTRNATVPTGGAVRDRQKADEKSGRPQTSISNTRGYKRKKSSKLKPPDEKKKKRKVRVAIPTQTYSKMPAAAAISASQKKNPSSEDQADEQVATLSRYGRQRKRPDILSPISMQGMVEIDVDVDDDESKSSASSSSSTTSSSYFSSKQDNIDEERQAAAAGTVIETNSDQAVGEQEKPPLPPSKLVHRLLMNCSDEPVSVNGADNEYKDARRPKMAPLEPVARPHATEEVVDDDGNYKQDDVSEGNAAGPVVEIRSRRSRSIKKKTFFDDLPSQQQQLKPSCKKKAPKTPVEAQGETYTSINNTIVHLKQAPVVPFTSMTMAELEPHDNDVISGQPTTSRGRFAIMRSQNHPGNVRLRQWIEQRKPEYNDKSIVAPYASLYEKKRSIICSIVRLVEEQRPPGRFLMYYESNNQWNVVYDQQKIYAYISRFLRLKKTRSSEDGHENEHDDDNSGSSHSSVSASDSSFPRQTALPRYSERQHHQQPLVQPQHRQQHLQSNLTPFATTRGSIEAAGADSSSETIMDKYERRFLERIDQLADYKKKHGHCYVPPKYQGHECLGKWAKQLRHNRKVGQLRGEYHKYIETLDRMGFVWDKDDGVVSGKSSTTTTLGGAATGNANQDYLEKRTTGGKPDCPDAGAGNPDGPWWSTMTNSFNGWFSSRRAE